MEAIVENPPHNIQITMVKAPEPRFLKMYYNKKNKTLTEEKPPSWMKKNVKKVYIRPEDYCKYYLEHPLFELGCADKSQLINRIFFIHDFYENVAIYMFHLKGDLPCCYDTEYNYDIASHSSVNYQYGFGYYMMDYDYTIIKERLSKIQTKYHLQREGSMIHNRKAHKWNIMRNLSSKKSRFVQKTKNDIRLFIEKKRSLKYYHKINLFEDRVITEFCMNMIQPHFLFDWHEMVNFSRRKVNIFWFEFVMKRLDYQRIDRICTLYQTTVFEYLEIDI